MLFTEDVFSVEADRGESETATTQPHPDHRNTFISCLTMTSTIRDSKKTTKSIELLTIILCFKIVFVSFCFLIYLNT